ncbi:MAG TPA: SRPBCC domain-containing protein [Oscillatoriaceae cyanobacterium]
MDRILHHTAHLDAPPFVAFELFATSAGLMRWLVPLAEVEPIVGGKYELFWNPDDRENDSTLGCKVTAVVPERLLAFEWRGPRQYKHFMNQADPLTHVVVSFFPEDDGTRVDLIHSGWRGTPEWEEARQWFGTAWRLGFEALAPIAAG